jgi:hypothetical protein
MPLVFESATATVQSLVREQHALRQRLAVLESQLAAARWRLGNLDDMILAGLTGHPSPALLFDRQHQADRPVRNAS